MLVRRCGVLVASCCGSGSLLCLDVAASMADCCGSSNSTLFRRCGVPYLRPHASDALARNVSLMTCSVQVARELRGWQRNLYHITPRPALRVGTATVSRFIESHFPKIGYIEFWCFAAQIWIRPHYPCALEIHSWDTAPTVNAQASEERSGSGGWAPVRNTEGELDPWLSPRFSCELTRKDWPWIFERGDRPSLIISTLEAFVRNS